MRIVAFGLALAAITVFLFWPQTSPEGDNTANFDYHVLALSWSPNWCKLEGDSKGSAQCDPRHDYGWTLHGLWPQFETSWPSDCPTSFRGPSKKLTESMVDIMGSAGLARHEWNKHGTCSGLSPEAYYASSRKAFESVVKPPVLRKIKKTVSLPARVVEDAFLESNPNLSADQITITCKRNHIQEARICLDKAFQPRRCGDDAIRDCRQEDAGFAPIR